MVSFGEKAKPKRQEIWIKVVVMLFDCKLINRGFEKSKVTLFCYFLLNFRNFQYLENTIFRFDTFIESSHPDFSHVKFVFIHQIGNPWSILCFFSKEFSMKLNFFWIISSVLMNSQISDYTTKQVHKYISNVTQYTDCIFFRMLHYTKQGRRNVWGHEDWSSSCLQALGTLIHHAV